MEGLPFVLLMSFNFSALGFLFYFEMELILDSLVNFTSSTNHVPTKETKEASGWLRASGLPPTT
jgi:hypothetical protein